MKPTPFRKIVPLEKVGQPYYDRPVHVKPKALAEALSLVWYGVPLPVVLAGHERVWITWTKPA